MLDEPFHTAHYIQMIGSRAERNIIAHVRNPTAEEVVYEETMQSIQLRDPEACVALWHLLLQVKTYVEKYVRSSNRSAGSGAQALVRNAI